MCLSCGCGSPSNDHGDHRNITRDDLEAAAEVAGIGVDEVVANIEEAAAEGFGGDALDEELHRDYGE